jgi:hypothetical protein
MPGSETAQAEGLGADLAATGNAGDDRDEPTMSRTTIEISLEAKASVGYAIAISGNATRDRAIVFGEAEGVEITSVQ